MTEIAKGRGSPLAGLAGDIRSLTTKQWASLVAGILIAVALVVYMGLNCFGFLIAAIVLYMLPHMMGVKSVKVKALAGAVFFILGTAALTMIASSNLEAQADGYDYDGSVSDFEYDGSDISFTVQLDDGDIVLVEVVQYTIYEYVDDTIYVPEGTEVGYEGATVIDTAMTVTDNGDGTYDVLVTGVDLAEGYLYYVFVGVVDNSTYSYLTLINEDGHSLTYIGLISALYTVGIATIAFAIILTFSTIMRNSAEKTRRRMEEQGRLYPQGYGRCKECGAMVLPGEIECRKCGAYIDVPEEMRVHRKNYFECSECGAEVPANANECPRCGAKFDGVDLSEEMAASGARYCPDCGNAVPANAEWCPRCGKMLKKE